MSSEESKLLSSPQSSYPSRSQPTYSPYESSQISLDPNKYDTNSTSGGNDTDKSFNTACVDCLQCCAGTMEFFLCCCMLFECLSMCK